MLYDTFLRCPVWSTGKGVLETLEGCALLWKTTAAFADRLCQESAVVVPCEENQRLISTKALDDIEQIEKGGDIK